MVNGLMVYSRFHMYEGKTAAEVTYPMKVMKLLGIEAVILTNAAGGLDPAMKVGTIVVLHDHVSLPSLVSINYPLLLPPFNKSSPSTESTRSAPATPPTPSPPLALLKNLIHPHLPLPFGRRQ